MWAFARYAADCRNVCALGKWQVLCIAKTARYELNLVSQFFTSGLGHFVSFFCVCVPILLLHVKDTGIDYYKCGLSTKREVKSFYGPKRNQGPETRKKERGQYPAILTEQAWSCDELRHNNRPALTNVTTVNKDFWGTFCRGTRRVIPSGQDSSILHARVANHSAGFGLSCPRG